MNRQSPMEETLSFFNSIHRLQPPANAALQEVMQVRVYGKNSIIQEIGTRCQTVYLVKDGGARIFYFKDGNDITEHFAFSQQLIVRAESLFTGKPTLKGIQAIDQTSIVAIDAASLFRLYDRHHGIERLFRLLFEGEYVNTLKRMESLQMKTAKERYLELLQNTDYIQKIPLKHIATYLGITQVSLSRIRAEIR